MEPNTTDAPPRPASAAAHKPPLLQSIKVRIIVFALAATIIPAITLGSLSYLQNTRFLSEKISQELHDTTAQVALEIDLIVKEKLHDVRVFANSYIVSENLSRLLSDGATSATNLVAMRLIQDYLRSVEAKFADYVELVLLDLNGQLIVSSAATANPPTLPAKWRETIISGTSVIGETVMEPEGTRSMLFFADPIRTANGAIIGVLGVKLSLETMDRVLTAYAQPGIRDVYLVNAEGNILASSRRLEPPAKDTSLDQVSVAKLSDRAGEAVTYEGYGGRTAIGTFRNMSTINLGVLTEMDKVKAFEQIEALQRMTLVLVVGLLVGIGLCAYLLGLTIVRPLRRLIRGADQVAAGDLEVDLPVGTHSEVGYLTQVFNHMVARLRRSRAELDSVNAELQAKNRELHKLSITDELTGLYNRNHLMQTLQAEIIRSGRNNHAFALLVIDVDHFKLINDTYGHQKGDDVLRRLAVLMKEAVRSCDYVARYGGEEFMVILPELRSAGGMEVAERIRARVAQERINPKGDCVTVSIGMAIFDEHGASSEVLFQKADQALYTAKANGRNRITVASADPESNPDKKALRLIPKEKRRSPR